MKISNLYNNKKIVYSFEVFPPKKNGNIDTIYKTLDELSVLSPDFISVTYGAGGNTADNKTVKIASLIKNKYNIEPVAHLTCINSSKEDIIFMLEEFKKNGIENVLALRGDKSPDYEGKSDFKYASDLISMIAQDKYFDIHAACYPECHPECDDLITDIRNLKRKVDLGASSLISQLFFDNEDFYTFKEKLLIAGIDAPISAGIMPVTNKSQIERMVTLCGASLPKKFVKILSKYENDPLALEDAGIAYACEQIIDLISNGVSGIHLYTMNKPEIAKRVTENIKNILNAANKG